MIDKQGSVALSQRLFMHDLQESEEDSSTEDDRAVDRFEQERLDVVEELPCGAELLPRGRCTVQWSASSEVSRSEIERDAATYTARYLGQ